MKKDASSSNLQAIKKQYPQKFASKDTIFSQIRPGDRIFISTGCGEPQYLVNSLVSYVESNPKAFFDAEILHVWTLGVAPYTQEKFKDNFRHNSFFISDNSREAVNKGFADYTPIFLSDVPALFRRRVVQVDVAFIQTSPPDEHGYLSLGISVDIVREAIENADLVVAQVNENMPRVHGDAFVHLDKLNYLVPYNEPLLEFEPRDVAGIAEKIGKYVARIVADGDTIQIGSGSVPNAVAVYLNGKKHLGIHTELLGDGLVQLIKSGAVDNTRKTINPWKTVASFCMGSRETYDYIDDNPGVEFRSIDFTNDPLIIARQSNMVAINSVLEIDLTGQATAESIGRYFYSGIGGQANFMRGAALAPGGKTIVVLPSITEDGKRSRIVPLLQEGAGVSLTRGDVHYVVTEYGTAYLHGKNIRERAMALIAIAHPNFRSQLIEEAKELSLIYKDQAFITGKRGEYPEDLEASRTTRKGLKILFRPVKISDEPLLKDFFYSLSDKSLYKRFLSVRKSMHHEELQESYVVIDYTEEMVLLAVIEKWGVEVIIGVAQYAMREGSLFAEAAIVVRDDFQNKGIGSELLLYLSTVAKKQGLKGFSAQVLPENRQVFHMLDKLGFKVEKKLEEGVFFITIYFKE